MLAASHDRAYQDFLTLLTEFIAVAVEAEQELDKKQFTQEFQNLSSWFQQHIAMLSDRDLAPAIASPWQSVQTEILREFKLLSTDILFLASARQHMTQQKRLKSINQRLTKLIGYCQILLNNAADKP